MTTPFLRLHEFGGDMVQGYLLSKPLLAREVEVALTKVAALGIRSWSAKVEKTAPEKMNPWLIDGEEVLPTLPRLSGRADPRGVPTSR